MKFVRLTHAKTIAYGILDGNQIQLIEGTPFSEYSRIPDSVPLDSAQLLAPCEPSKIIAVGVNYADHASEFQKELPKEPLLFLKPSTAILDPFKPIQLPESSHRVDFEAELAVVIGKRAFGISPHEAMSYILGYTCFNDVTARDLQKKDGQWTRAKSFDTFAPFGPCIDTDVDPDSLTVESYLNGELRQCANTSQLIFNVSSVVSFISQVMTLLPGDLIATGTPAGVGPMKAGDTIEVKIEGVGRLVNPVA